MRPTTKRPTAIKARRPQVGVKTRQLKQNNGKLLEDMLTMTNRTYRLKRAAIIHKQHPEVKTIRDHRGQIRETIYSERSGLDYAGTVRGGRYVTFEAKQVKEKNRFPFDMMEAHQIETMRESAEMGGHAFLVVFFVRLDMAFLIRPEFLLERYDEYVTRKRRAEASKTRLKPGEASLSFDEIKTNGYPIIEGQGVFLNWLGAYHEAFGTDA